MVDRVVCIMCIGERERGAGRDDWGNCVREKKKKSEG